MCKVADIAMMMINKSIHMAKQAGDDRYLMDFEKLHKLLYLGQCCMMSQYGRTLFEEDITAHRCGPYVDDMDFIPAKCGFGPISIPFPASDFVVPAASCLAVIDWVLETFGVWSTTDIIRYTISTPPYRAVERQISETDKPIIPVEIMGFAFCGNVAVKQVRPESLTTAWA